MGLADERTEGLHRLQSYMGFLRCIYPGNMLSILFTNNGTPLTAQKDSISWVGLTFFSP